MVNKINVLNNIGLAIEDMIKELGKFKVVVTLTPGDSTLIRTNLSILYAKDIIVLLRIFKEHDCELVSISTVNEVYKNGMVFEVKGGEINGNNKRNSKCMVGS